LSSEKEAKRLLFLGAGGKGIMMFVGAVLALLLCQLVGEILARALMLPVPGPVLGMVLLATALIWRGRLAVELGQAADFLLRHLSLFFVPAAAGIVVNGGAIAREWLAISVSLIVSTALAMAVAAKVFVLLARFQDKA
jgi:holin-like protein